MLSHVFSPDFASFPLRKSFVRNTCKSIPRFSRNLAEITRYCPPFKSRRTRTYRLRARNSFRIRTYIKWGEGLYCSPCPLIRACATNKAPLSRVFSSASVHFGSPWTYLFASRFGTRIHPVGPFPRQSAQHPGLSVRRSRSALASTHITSARPLQRSEDLTAAPRIPTQPLVTCLNQTNAIYTTPPGTHDAHNAGHALNALIA